jgi:ribosomal protein S18 acetylase RimI-like enzyme
LDRAAALAFSSLMCMETTRKQPAVILPAGLRDLRQVVRVEKECFRDDAWPLVDILSVLIFPGIIRLKAMVDDQVVGFASAEVRSGVGWITTIGVVPAFRRRGIARVLLAACEEQLATPRIRLCVRRSNYAAQVLYQQQEYRQVDIWPRYYRGNEDALVMEKSR